MASKVTTVPREPQEGYCVGCGGRFVHYLPCVNYRGMANPVPNAPQGMRVKRGDNR